MPAIESVRVTVVLEFDVSTSTSKGTTLLNIETAITPMLHLEGGSLGSHVNVRGSKIKSMTVEPRHG